MSDLGDTMKHNKLWRQTFTGKRINPLDPKPEDIDIIDIAHHLAFQNRYAGSARGVESIAEHSVLMARHVMRQAEHAGSAAVPYRYKSGSWNLSWTGVAKHVLMHDAPEYLLQDISRPLKIQLYVKDPATSEFITYKQLEHKVKAIINPRFGLATVDPPIIDELDARIVRNEARSLMLHDDKWLATKPGAVDFVDLPFEIEEWDFPRAEREFIKTYNALWGSE